MLHGLFKVYSDWRATGVRNKEGKVTGEAQGWPVRGVRRATRKQERADRG